MSSSAAASVTDLHPAAGFLTALRDPARRRMEAGHIAIVIAHPDDETIGCGALLPRLAGVQVALVTDGAPEDMGDAQASGFSSRTEYADARAAELARVLDLAGLPASALHSFGVRDQTAAFHLSGLTADLIAYFQRHGTALVLTHAYEGGHPDHDATAFAVHAAARLLARRGQPLEIVEMPLYHAGPEGWQLQSFPAGPATPTVEVVLDERQCAFKRRLIEAHATQRAVLANFTIGRECFRMAPRYNFGELPNGGDLLYERYGWGMTGERWRSLVSAALSELGLGAQP